MLGMLRRWLRRLFGIRNDAARKRPAMWPTREEIDLLPPFQGLGLEDIIVVASPSEAHRAAQELMTHAIVGFDTESKPTFTKGQVSTGPHVVQFSTRQKAYVFLLHDHECRKTAGKLIGAGSLKKVGFGLSGDLTQIRAKLGVHPREVLDLQSLFAAKGLGKGVGLKVGVAMALKRRIFKSKKTTTTNWALRRLTDKQLLYAANDAYAALAVHHALTAA